jgi:hypothetical protein
MVWGFLITRILARTGLLRPIVLTLGVSIAFALFLKITGSAILKHPAVVSEITLLLAIIFAGILIAALTRPRGARRRITIPSALLSRMVLAALIAGITSTSIVLTAYPRLLTTLTEAFRVSSHRTTHVPLAGHSTRT